MWGFIAFCSCVLAGSCRRCGGLAYRTMEHRMEKKMASVTYRQFKIETFEGGRGFWHARFHRADRKPMVLDGEQFATVHPGISWPTSNAAIPDAEQFIDAMARFLS
jgi:hypothetical protein